LLIKEPALGGNPAITDALLQALERTRTTLVIAIAEETKLTPPTLRQYYLETADSMRRCIKKLSRRLRNGVKDENKWLVVLEELHNLSKPEARHGPGEVLQMCKRLQDILTAISPTDD
jgi:hypothetical protein